MRNTLQKIELVSKRQETTEDMDNGYVHKKQH